MRKEKEKTRSHRFSRFTRKHRRHSNGNKQGNETMGQPVVAPLAEGPDQTSATYLPTDDSSSGRGHGSSERPQRNGQRADPGPYNEFISSSSSAYMSNDSSSSSDSGRPTLIKEKAVRAHETKGTDDNSNFHASQHLRGGADMVTRHHDTRAMGELAIERFLEDGNSVPGAIQHGDVHNLESNQLEAIAEDYFTQPRHGDQRRRARGFSFIAGDDDSLPVSPMALPPPMQPDNDGSTEEPRQRWSQDNGYTIQVPAPSDIRQPRPRSTLPHSAGLSVARQLQQAVATNPSIDPAPSITTPAQALGTAFAATEATTTPTSGQRRPASTGSVIYLGEPPSSTAAGSRDSTGSRITVLRDNSGRASSSRRQSSQSQATSDLSLESSPAVMPPITEGRSFNPVSSPTPSTRGGGGGGGGGSGKTKSARRRGGAPSATSSPALPPMAAEGGGGGGGAGGRPTAAAPSLGPLTPSTGNAPPPPREPSGGAGGPEPAAGQAARIAAALAHARGQKRSSQL